MSKPKVTRRPQNLLEAYEEKGLTRKSAAARMGIPAQRLTEIECGSPIVSDEHRRLGALLGVVPRNCVTLIPSTLEIRRRAVGLSVEAFAEKLGVGPNTVYCWERGTRLPKSSAMLARIAKALGCSVVVLSMPAKVGADEGPTRKA